MKLQIVKKETRLQTRKRVTVILSDAEAAWLDRYSKSRNKPKTAIMELGLQMVMELDGVEDICQHLKS